VNCVDEEGTELLRIPRRFMADAILIIIVVTVVPVIILLLLQTWEYPLDNLLFGLRVGFYVTLPSGISLATAYLLARSYLVHGQVRILTFGSAMLMWGWVNVATIVFTLFASTFGPGWTAGSIGELVSSMLHFSGVLPSDRGSSSKSLTSRLALAYVSVTVAAAVLICASFGGISQAFFGAGGSTLLDKAFTSLSIILFSASSILFFMKAQKNAKPLFLYWYSVGLAIFAVTLIPSLWGLSGVFRAGDLNALATVAGSLCFLYSALVCLKENLYQQVKVRP
jgi:hypothetical protein